MALRTSLVAQPHLYMGDTTGRPLDGGKVYFGEPNKDPEFHPINVFYDEASTIVAPQPIRTKGGFMNANGQMIKVFALEVEYSVKVLDAYGRQVFYVPVMTRINTDASIIVQGGVSQKDLNTGFGSLASIESISGANIGMRVYSKSLTNDFEFKANSTEPVNGVTVLQGIGGVWEMVTPSVYYASWFADSASTESQAAKLQQGYDYATKKRRPFIIDDEFWVDARATQTGMVDVKTAFAIRSNSVLKFQNKGKLKVIPNNYTNYLTMVAMDDVTNFIILNPNLEGDRLTHDYPALGTSEFGYGLTLYECSKGYIERPIIRQMTGDGLYVGKVWDSPNGRVPTDIVVMCPLIEYVRRNGISFCAWDNVKIIEPVVNYVGAYNGISGAAPSSGIDVEPEKAPSTPSTICRNGVIHNFSSSHTSAGIASFINIDNLQVEVSFTGITRIDNYTDFGTNLSQGASKAVGALTIDHLHLGYAGKDGRHIGFLWSGDGDMYLNINRVSYDFGLQRVLFIHNYGFGTFAAKKLGNVSIRNIEALGTVFYLQPSGVNNSIYTMSYFNLTKAYDSLGSIKMDDTLTNYALPDSTCNIEAEHTIVTSTALSGYRGGNIINVKGTGETPIVINASGIKRRIIVRNDNLAGYNLKISGIGVNINGTAYSEISTTTRGAWLDFEVVTPQVTIIHGKSDGWTFA